MKEIVASVNDQVPDIGYLVSGIRYQGPLYLLCTDDHTGVVLLLLLVTEWCCNANSECDCWDTVVWAE